MKSIRCLSLALFLPVLACGDDGSAAPDAGTHTHTLADFLPVVPTPDGTPQSVFAGVIADASELITGPAKSGLPGDFYIRNGKARFVIQSEARAIGVVPWGGNVVDAVPLAADGTPLAQDHLGEVSLVYLLGRTCAHDSVEVLLDGSGGGPAVIRAIGHAAPNDFINLAGIGLIPIPADLDPDEEDQVDCATTYTLMPDSPTLDIAWTLYNGGNYHIEGPLGALNDTGGQVESFSPAQLGFNRASIEALIDSSDPQPAPYAIYQGPGVAYGLIPVHADRATPNATFLVAGVSIIIYNAQLLWDILEPERFHLDLLPDAGITNSMRLVIGQDGADIDAEYERGWSTNLTAVTGVAEWTGGAPGAGARVGIYRDLPGMGEGALDDRDHIVTYADVDATGAWAADLPAGSYYVRADVKDVARSAVADLTVAGAPVTAPTLTLPAPARYDFSVVDAETGNPLPAKITVVGRHAAPADFRVHETYDRRPGVVNIWHTLYGTTVPVAPGDPVDAQLVLPAGGPYKIYVTHGPEWSFDEAVVTPGAGDTGTLNFELRRVLDTNGYIAAEFHQHALGSPDSPVAFDDRLKSLVTEGVEFFSSTDHDYLTDYDPLIDQFQMREWIDGVVGIESTPFAFGHFIAYPQDLDPNDPSNGAVDWADGEGEFYAMRPGDLWAELRQRGAQVIQVNHPRGLSAFEGFQAYFDRADLLFDFTAKSFAGAGLFQPVPNDVLRLPGENTLWSDSFDTLEVWNGFATDDTDFDGVRELTKLDKVMRDWMNFLSFGKIVTPIGNSDTHTREKDPAGMPRTMIRVTDDSPVGLQAGLDDEIYAAILGTSQRDVVVTDGPMLAVSTDGGATSAIGRTVVAAGGTVTLTIAASSADWVDIDTIEIFANSTYDNPERVTDPTPLQPLVCYTTRTLASLQPTDPCALAALPAQAMTVDVVNLSGPGSYARNEASIVVTIAATDIPKRMGAAGDDAWLVVRVRGQRAVFPVLVEGVVDDTNVDTIVSGTAMEIDAILRARGVPAAAFTAPILVDFDGGGFKAPFAP